MGVGGRLDDESALLFVCRISSSFIFLSKLRRFLKAKTDAKTPPVTTAAAETEAEAIL